MNLEYFNHYINRQKLNPLKITRRFYKQIGDVVSVTHVENICLRLSLPSNRTENEALNFASLWLSLHKINPLKINRKTYPFVGNVIPLSQAKEICALIVANQFDQFAKSFIQTNYKGKEKDCHHHQRSKTPPPNG
jgi:hypothetical protein